MKESKKELFKIISEAGIDTAMGIFNVMTFGIAMNITDLIDNIIQHGKGVRDAHYALQVKAFLETPTNLTGEEFKKFMEDNPDNQRLGLEIFKVLEQTVTEEQAKMLSRALVLWIKGNYRDKFDFNGDIYLIKSMDGYLLEMFKQIGEAYEDKNYFFNGSPIKHLENLGLVKQVKNTMKNFENEISYQASIEGIQFYNRILKEL